MTRPAPVVIALGSNIGDRRWHLRSAVHLLSEILRVVRLSGVWETDPVDCPPGAERFLNMALSGVTHLPPAELMENVHAIEDAVGRRRRKRNDSRVIDIDLIFYGALLSNAGGLAIPHPRYSERDFVLRPLEELGIDWTVGGTRIRSLGGQGLVRRVGSLY